MEQAGRAAPALLCSCKDLAYRGRCWAWWSIYNDILRLMYLA